MARASAIVKILDAQQETLKVDTRDLVGIDQPEGRIVVVRGVARRDEAGNLTVLAKQIYVRPPAPPRPVESDKP